MKDQVSLVLVEHDERFCTYVLTWNQSDWFIPSSHLECATSNKPCPPEPCLPSSSSNPQKCSTSLVFKRNIQNYKLLSLISLRLWCLVCFRPFTISNIYPYLFKPIMIHYEMQFRCTTETKSTEAIWEYDVEKVNRFCLFIPLFLFFLFIFFNRFRTSSSSHKSYLQHYLQGPHTAFLRMLHTALHYTPAWPQHTPTTPVSIYTLQQGVYRKTKTFP